MEVDSACVTRPGVLPGGTMTVMLSTDRPKPYAHFSGDLTAISDAPALSDEPPGPEPGAVATARPDVRSVPPQFEVTSVGPAPSRVRCNTRTMLGTIEGSVS